MLADILKLRSEILEIPHHHPLNSGYILWSPCIYPEKFSHFCTSRNDGLECRISHLPLHKHFSQTYEIIDMVACSLRWYSAPLNFPTAGYHAMKNRIVPFGVLGIHVLCDVFERVFSEYSRIYAAMCTVIVQIS